MQSEPKDGQPDDTLGHDKHPSNLSEIEPIVGSSSSANTFLSFDDVDSDEPDLPSSPSVLKQELQATRSLLKEAEIKISKLQSTNRKSVDPGHAAKTALETEVAGNRELANELEGNRNILTPPLTSSHVEIKQLIKAKAQLEQACHELRKQRDQLGSDIANLIGRLSLNNFEEERLIGHFREAFQQQLKSIQADIKAAQEEYQKLVQSRKDIMNEMVLLNTKNAELASLNNDMSRRMSEREREVMAVMAGTNFLDPSSEKKSSPRRHKHTASDIATDLRQLLGLSRSEDGQRKSMQRSSFDATEAAIAKKFRSKRATFFGGNSSSCSSIKSTQKTDDTTIEEGEVQSSSSSSSQFGADHQFGQTKFLRPVRCDVCGDMLWGTELKCQACGLVCHSRCSQSSSQSCALKKRQSGTDIGSTKRTARVFGNELGKLLQIERNRVPNVVTTCIKAVEARGMSYEGIYRKSGGAGQMRQIQQLFEQGQTPDLLNEKQWNDICAITSVLKQYFRSLPDPLFTYRTHNQFIQASKIRDPREKLQRLRQLIQTALPPANYATMRYLLNHLNRVQQRQCDNLMTGRNLAVIFGPTLLRNQDETEDLIEMNRKIEIIDFILHHHDEIFRERQ